EDQQQLAGDVEALEIVPFELRRGDAVAHENGLRIELRIGLLGLADTYEIVEPFEVDLLARGGRAQSGIGLGLHAYQRDSLKPGAVVARRFGAGEFELRGDVLGGQVAPALADAAAFQQIAREEPVVGANAFGGDRGVLRQQRRQGDHRYPDRLNHDQWYP